MTISSITSTQELPFELRSLASAKRYQKWLYRTVTPFLGKRILELGAGIGNMSRWLPLRERLILTENDEGFLQILQRELPQTFAYSPKLSIRSLDLNDGHFGGLSEEDLDTIISFNVLEHIEKDDEVLRQLGTLLKQSKATGPKRLVTLVPAHQWAYGEMDRSFGHYRRYSAQDWKRLHRETAPEAKLFVRYMNSFGLAGWVLNGRILKKSSIGMGSIQTFEALCPFLAPIDDALNKYIHLPFGQSVLAVFEWES